MSIVNKYIYFYCFGRLSQLNSLKEVIISMSERYEYKTNLLVTPNVFLFSNKMHLCVYVSGT